jgi:hypothetical protein
MSPTNRRLFLINKNPSQPGSQEWVSLYPAHTKERASLERAVGKQARAEASDLIIGYSRESAQERRLDQLDAADMKFSAISHRGFLLKVCQGDTWFVVRLTGNESRGIPELRREFVAIEEAGGRAAASPARSSTT